ncbi:folate family ECF transporter S component [Clostridium estertheticum]|uniref:folate family ECF transporter S component n=1 Tax=Clostridium estertheticum TaxID=238834 RepID=UPI0013E97E23|nr:folate family ECF transporter S component [Clostridium estertheticum]MBZ9685266.1 folate family ECF transporter S component [Clostridium estertheticum]
MKGKMSTKTLVSTSVFIAIAVILRSISIMIPIGGAGAMRISIDGIFYILPGIIFGPIYGAFAGGIVDILAYILRPMGPYIPLFTLTTMLSGFIPGLIWKYTKFAGTEKLVKYYIACFTTLGLTGIVNTIVILVFPKSNLGKLIFSLGKKTQFIGIGLEIIALLGFVILFINNVIKRNNSENKLYDNYIKMILAIGLPAILISSINTYFLILFIPGLSSVGFMVLWIPRITEACLMILIQSYIISILLNVYELVFRIDLKC